MTSVLILLSGFDPGTYFIEDDGIPGNGIAQLRGPDGSVIFFNIPTEFLTVTASAGRSIIFNLTESFGSADINVGNLTNAAENPDFIQIRSIAGAGDVLMVSNSTITELGTDAAADIVANTLILSAVTGIGAPSNPIETRVATIEAETTTGGIAITNSGNVTIGGLTDNVEGLDVDTSGDITFTNFGTITVNEASPGAFESIHGGNTSGNVSLIANGFDSDITSGVDQDFMVAPGGNILLQAGRDVSLGTGGANFDNDVRARGTLTVISGRDVNVDGFADLASDGFGAVTGGNLVITAGRDINVLNSTGTDGSIGAEGSGGADVILTTGPGGFVRLLATSTSTLFSSTGDITVNADRMVISSVAGITASGGIVSLRPVTPGWGVNLGSVTDGAFALELSDIELNRIFTPNLVVGATNSGPVVVSANISPASAPNLIIRSGTDITVNASITTGSSVSLRPLDNLFQIGASIITTTSFTAFVDSVDTDPGVGGIAILNGGLTTTTAVINGNPDKDTLNGSGANETLNGLAGNDTLRGFGGNDILVGGPGIDIMVGGLGDDFFFVDSAGDFVDEAVGEGTGDRVFASVSYVLPGAEIEILSTNDNLATTPINLTGNSFTQTIFGNAGANTLDSGFGGDTLVGFGGDDFYIIRSAGDRAVEAAAGGTADRVFAAVSFTLEAGSQVEILSTIDNLATTAINLTGNALNQTIFGNAGANTLDSGGGSDTMVGFGGDDFYFIRTPTDRAVEAAAGGNDRVFSADSFTLEAGSHIDMLTPYDFTTVNALNFTGNALPQAIFGNAGANTLDGGGGVDILIGLGGDDFFIIRSGADRAVETVGNGNDRVFATVNFTLEAGSHVEILSTIDNLATTPINLTGNELANSIFGNAGANSLDSGGGGDTMLGLGGNDFYFIRSGSDRAVESSGAGSDRVFAAVSFTLEAGSHVEILSTIDNLAVTAINLTGNELANTIFGNAGANVLDGKGGSDTLVGLDGADMFAFTTALGAGNVDNISGFQVGVDDIALDDAIFTGLAPGALPAAAFRVGNAALDADDRIIYDSASGAIYFDPDGTGAAAAIVFATVSPGLAMTAGDFVVI